MQRNASGSPPPWVIINSFTHSAACPFVNAPPSSVTDSASAPRLSRPFLSAFFRRLRRRFGTRARSRARNSFFPFFSPFSLSPVQPNSPFSSRPRPACLPGCRALRCRPFAILSVPLDYVFFSRASFLFLILLSFSPCLPLSPPAFRHFSLFLYLFPERSSTSDTFLFLFHSYSLFFGRIGLFFPFPVAAPSPSFLAPLFSILST